MKKMMKTEKRQSRSENRFCEQDGTEVVDWPDRSTRHLRHLRHRRDFWKWRNVVTYSLWDGRIDGRTDGSTNRGTGWWREKPIYRGAKRRFFVACQRLILSVGWRDLSIRQSAMFLRKNWVWRASKHIYTLRWVDPGTLLNRSYAPPSECDTRNSISNEPMCMFLA